LLVFSHTGDIKKNKILNTSLQRDIVRESFNIFPVVSYDLYTIRIEILRVDIFMFNTETPILRFFGVGDSMWKNLVQGNHEDSTVEEIGSRESRRVYKGMTRARRHPPLTGDLADARLRKGK
ncbi:hypothetical protein Dsin_009234, partial [Dipteronia sinensis]